MLGCALDSLSVCQISKRSEHAFAFYSTFCKCAKRRRRKKTKKKKPNFGRSYLRNGLSDFLQIWYVDFPSWRATLQQIWFQSDKLSPRYKSVKMTFSFFLSIYSRCGTPASWTARHTIACLDYRVKSEVSITLRCQLCSTRYTAFRIKNCSKSTSTIHAYQKKEIVPRTPIILIVV